MADAGAAPEAATPDLAGLAARAGRGDQGAFRALVDATHALVFRVALRMVGDRAEAEDVVQETYIRAWQSLAKLADAGAVKGWLCRIATHAATDRLRRRKKGTVSLDADDDERAAIQIASPDVSADELVAQKGTREFVGRALALLSDEHRVVLLLKEVDGMTAQEIGEALGVPTGTVESRLHRARAMLGKHVERAARQEKRRWPWE